MRDIKFRGKSRKTGKWLVGDLIHNRGCTYWFKDYNYKEPMAIIHFTKFRY